MPQYNGKEMKLARAIRRAESLEAVGELVLERELRRLDPWGNEFSECAYADGCLADHDIQVSSLLARYSPQNVASLSLPVGGKL